MKRRDVYLLIILTLIWTVLCESFSLPIILCGIVASLFCLLLYKKYIPYHPLTNINFTRLIVYPLFLIVQIYLAGFNVIAIVLSGEEVEIVKIKTDLSNEMLRIVLMNSITLTPGSVVLDLQGDEITVLWLRKASKKPQSDRERETQIKGKLEMMLLRAQKDL